MQSQGRNEIFHPEGGMMRVLIVDDDFYCRSFLQEILHPYAYCDIAVNGEEAIYAFKKALEEKRPYDLICMDIVMPDIDGHMALREIRAIEREMNVPPATETKVIMTTVLDDSEETHNAFYLGGATSYMVKPINEAAMIKEMKRLGLIRHAEA
jgi:two-component system chemotaxis response regulator CheY